MNLIKTLIDRLTKIDRIKFDEFDKNYNKNHKIVKQYLKIILKDVDCMMEYPLIAQYEDALLDMEEKLGFASRLSKMRECFEELKEISEELNSAELSEKLDKCIEKGLSLL